MKHRPSLHIAWGSLLLLFATTAPVAAQGGQGFETWPGSLTLDTWTGTVIVSEAGLRPVYYLDVDGDGAEDYHLSFGPWWFEPSSGAVRPVDGQEVTLLAALWECEVPNTLMVFEIDGLVWREAVETTADGLTTASGWKTGPTRRTVTGTFMVDDTYFYPHYYLDVDADGLPDYQLEFGPHWYAPTSGVELPADGAVVTITGGFKEVEDGIDILAVYEIDGVVWRDSEEPPPWAGRWVSTGDGAAGAVHLGSDPASVIEFVPGAFGGFGDQNRHGNRNGGQVGSGAVFVEFLPVHPDWLPGIGDRDRDRDRLRDCCEDCGEGCDGTCCENCDGGCCENCGAGCDGTCCENCDCCCGCCENCGEGCDGTCCENCDCCCGCCENCGEGCDGSCCPDCDQDRDRDRDRDCDGQAFTGFYLDVYDEQGQSMMQNGFGQGEGHLRFEHANRFRFRWDEPERARRHLEGDDIGVQHWNRNRQAWEDVPDVTVDPVNHLVTFTSAELYSYYAIVAAAAPANVSTAVEPTGDVPTSVELGQNYPNPFNPVTVIPFTVTTPQRVVLKVFNALGVEVATLLDGMVPAGSHVARFDATQFATGVYFYAIRGDGWQAARHMTLVR